MANRLNVVTICILPDEAASESGGAGDGAAPSTAAGPVAVVVWVLLLLLVSIVSLSGIMMATRFSQKSFRAPFVHRAVPIVRDIGDLW